MDANAQREYIMGEVRYSIYFCTELWESYCKAKNDHNNELKKAKDTEYLLQNGEEGEGFELSQKLTKNGKSAADILPKNGENGKSTSNILQKSGKNGKSAADILPKNKKTERPGGAERALNGILNRIKNSQKPKQLAANVLRAKGLYKQISVVDKVIDSDVNTELEYALYLSTQLSNLTEEVLQNFRRNEDRKKQIIDSLTTQTGVPIFCTYCKNKTVRHLDFCPTCGKVQVFYT